MSCKLNSVFYAHLRKMWLVYFVKLDVKHENFSK